MRFTSVFALITLVSAAPVPSVVGDVEKALYPGLKTAVLAAIDTTMKETSEAIQGDLVDLIDHEIPSWVPSNIRQKFETFVKNQIFERVSNIALKTVKNKFNPRVEQILAQVDGKVMEIDVQVDHAVDAVHDTIREKLGLPPTFE